MLHTNIALVETREIGKSKATCRSIYKIYSINDSRTLKPRVHIKA